MTNRQRGLVWKCAITVGFIVFFFVFLEHDWLQWVFGPLFVLALIFERPPHTPPDIEAWVRTYPFVKIWLVCCALIIAAVALMSVTSMLRIDEALGFRGLLGLFLVAIAPLVAVGVWETYKRYGKEKVDAI